MARRPFPQRVVLVLFLASVLASPAVVAEQQRPRSENRPVTLVAGLVSELRAHVWRFLSDWAKNGCIIDPHGGCTSSTTTGQGDAGCIADPNGGCTSSTTDVTVQGDNGCGIDPHGGCGH